MWKRKSTDEHKKFTEESNQMRIKIKRIVERKRTAGAEKEARKPKKKKGKKDIEE